MGRPIYQLSRACGPSDVGHATDRRPPSVARMGHVRLLALLTAAAACGGAAVEIPTTGMDPGPPISAPTLATTPSGVATSLPAPSQAPCETGEGFVGHGTIGTLHSGDGDAVAVGGIRWEDHGTCERVVVDFVDDAGGPAGLPASAQASFFDGRRIIRVRMTPEVTVSALADVEMGMSLAERGYVVRGLDGGLFVDIHLGGAATARAFTLEEPGRIVIDLQPGGQPVETAPDHNDTMVVTTPRPGDATNDPISIAGYARTRDGQVNVTGSMGRAVHVESSTNAAAWVDTWGEFMLQLRVGDLGPLELSVGSAATGDTGGDQVTLEVEVR